MLHDPQAVLSCVIKVLYCVEVYRIVIYCVLLCCMKQAAGHAHATLAYSVNMFLLEY